MNKKCLLFSVVILTSIAATSVFSQVDLSRYYNENSLPFLSRSKPLKVDFKWDMDGRSQALLNECINYLDAGDFQLALSNADSFVNRNYENWAGHYYRGQSLMRLSRFKEAAVEFGHVTNINSKLVEGYVQLGEAYERQNNFEKAKEQFQKAIDVNPKFAYGYYKMGSLSLSHWRTEEATGYYKKCNKIDPQFPDAYMALGIITFQKNRKSDAPISFFNKALQVDSTFAQAYFWKGLSYLDQNKKDACIKSWSKFIDYNPRNQFVRTMRGFLNAELRNFDEAFSDFRKVLQNTSINEDKFQGAQTALDKKLDLQFAANYLIKKGFGLKEEAFENLKAGFCLMLMDRDREAMDYLRKAEMMTTSPAIYFLMAIAFEHGGVHNTAFRYYTECLKYDNDIFDAHKKRSIYYSELKRWDAAYKDINELLRIQPGAPVAYKLKGLIESSQGKYIEAVEDLTRFIVTDSTDVDAFRNRALAYSMSKRPAQANSDLRALFELNQTEQMYQGMINDLVVIKDTLNLLFTLKSFQAKFDYIDSFNEISKILMAQRKYDEVIAEVIKMRESLAAKERNNNISFKPDFSGTRSILSQLEGSVAFEQSKCEEAISFFTTSLKENSHNKESKYLRGKCYMKTGNAKKAAEDFKDLKGKQYKDADQLYETVATK